VRIDVEQLTLGVRWWELAGHASASLTEAWRQTHYSAQAAAEVGKSWGQPAEDDSHTSLAWFDGAGLLEGALVGQVAGAGSAPVRTALRLNDLRLLLLSSAGAPLEQAPVAGMTLAESIRWIRSAAARHAGPALHEARPAPDLPAHPLGQGARLGEPRQLAQVELIRLYANANRMLARIAAIASEEGASVSAWPHHFDIATLLTIEEAEDGSAQRTVGFGLTPPDDLVADGYWYVSGWSARTAQVAAGAMAPLAHGRWIARPGAAPMAALPVGEVTALGADPDGAAPPEEQQARVAGFLTSALRATLEAMGGD
jgi:hypothetical protein